MTLKYRPKNLVIGVLTQIPIFLFGGFGAYITAGLKLLILFIIFILSYLIWFINRKIVLCDNEIKVTSWFKSRRVKFDEISSLKIGLYRHKFSNATVPSLRIYSFNNKVLINILYLPYRKSDMATIVDFILIKNRNVSIDKEVRAILNKEITLTEDKFKRSNINGIIVAITGVLLYIIYEFILRH